MIRYGDLPISYSNSKKSRIVLVPVPYDATSTWMKGSAKGPAAIMDASRNMELYDTETGSEVFRRGIFTDEPPKIQNSAELMIHHVQKVVGAWLNDGKYVVTIGGEHSVSIGAVRAYHKKFPGLSVLQLDAHTDLRQDYQGSPYNHACTMARIRELCPITQVGIRSMDIEEKKYLDPGRVFYQEKIINQKDWMEKAIKTLSDQVYLTADLDVLDPSIMPSTGTPEPGGMDWYTMISFIRKVTEKKELVGFDVVELCPSKQNKAPDFLAAKLIYKILGYRFNT
ncbi:agmatinase [Bacteroidota bacterium]